MSKPRILHITPWYPSDRNPKEALWIQRHIQALDRNFQNEVLHLFTEKGPLKFELRQKDNLRTLRISLPVESWAVKEIVLSIALLWLLVRYYPASRYKAWNFHIAYPNLVWLSALKALFRVKWLITEHWSYYHFHFYSNKPLQRVKAIFHRNIPVIAVSKALADDIKSFSGSQKAIMLVPNIVDTEVFRYQEGPVAGHFFSMAFWKSPKDPLALLNAIGELKDAGKYIRLRIGGYGPQWDEMIKEAERLGISSQIDWLGPLDEKQIAKEMQEAKAFLMPSDYETFSVVTAEALCCGCPVIASASGALQELVTNGKNGFLVHDKAWAKVLGSFDELSGFKREEIALQASGLYSREVVAAKYSAIISEL